MSLEELAIPDLDLIKQEEQGVRGRGGRLARGTMKKISRMVPMAAIMKKLANLKKPMIAIRRKLNDAAKRVVAARWCVLRDALCWVGGSSELVKESLAARPLVTPAEAGAHRSVARTDSGWVRHCNCLKSSEWWKHGSRPSPGRHG